jgi:hypothetical protein
LKDIFPFSKNEQKIVSKKLNQRDDSLSKKLSKNYIDKLSLILHDSIYYKDYPLKRKNLYKTVYKNLENNKMHLTFKKFPKNNTSLNNNSQNNPILNNNPNKVYSLKKLVPIKGKQNDNINKTFSISDDINNILFNKEEKMSLSKQKKIHDKFKPKFLYYKPKLLSQLNSPFFSHYSELSLNKNKSLSNLYSYNHMNNLFKVCNSLKALRDKKKLNENILKNKQKFLEEIKGELIPCKNKKIKKKIFLSDYDFFYYDAKKWKKINDEIIKSDINKINQMNKRLNDNISNIQYRNKFYKEKLVKLQDKKNYGRKSLLEFHNYYQ